jgi:phage terminase small subunit
MHRRRSACCVLATWCAPDGRPRPARTPTKELKFRGTFRKDRHGDPASEPDFELVDRAAEAAGVPRRCRARWNGRRVGPELIDKQLLTVADMAAFTLYCVSVSRVVACEKRSISKAW